MVVLPITITILFDIHRATALEVGVMELLAYWACYCDGEGKGKII